MRHARLCRRLPCAHPGVRLYPAFTFAIGLSFPPATPAPRHKYAIAPTRTPRTTGGPAHTAASHTGGGLRTSLCAHVPAARTRYLCALFVRGTGILCLCRSSIRLSLTAQHQSFEIGKSDRRPGVERRVLWARRFRVWGELRSGDATRPHSQPSRCGSKHACTTIASCTYKHPPGL